MKRASLHLIQEIMQILLRNDPTNYWRAVQMMVRRKESSTIAQGFSKSSIRTAGLLKNHGLATLYETLYTRGSDDHIQRRLPEFDPGQVPDFTKSEVQRVIKNTGIKITGIDGLNITTLKSLNHRRLLLYKLSSQFSSWLRRGDYTDYCKHA